MDATRFEPIAREVLQLLDQQVAALSGRRFEEFSRHEAEAYRARKRRILKLRSELAKILEAV